MAAQIISLPELCPDCGREWSARFGRHNCNFTRRYVHNRAVVCQPGATLLHSVQNLAERQTVDAMASANFAELGGEYSPYPSYLGDIDAVIGFLKRHRAEMQRLAGHSHRWNEDDYCDICGADGRA